MATPLNALIIEDSPDDAELLAYELRDAGFAVSWVRVETEADFLAELARRPDIILSDYAMPRFSGLRAAILARESGLGIPFILISGTVGEDLAVEAMRYGATDYLLKDRIARLGSAVERALREAREHAEHKRLQEEVALREQRLNAFFSAASAGLVLLDKELRFIQVSDTLAEMNGAPVKDHLGRTVRDIIPALAPQIEPILQNVLATGDSVLNVAVTGETARQPGMLRHWMASYFPVLGKDGKPECVGAIVVEITERMRAEESSRASEERFREIAENIREVFWVTDPTKNEMLYISPAYETIWGRSCQSLYDSPRTWLEAIHPKDRDRVVQAALTKQNAGTYDEEYRIVRPDGAIRWIHDHAFPVRNPAGEVYRMVGVAEDITERRKLEDQYRQAQKMEAIGQLAGGVAHDFNNILAVIQMQCDLMRDGGSLSPAQQEFTEDITAAAQRAAALTRQLLLFSRKEVMQPRDLDLNQSFGNMTKMVQRILGEQIQVQFNFSAQPLYIHADPGMMDQVLMNLVVNSRDAMPRGGRLAIETSAVELDDLAAAQSPNARAGSFVCLAVSDTGCGIPAENLTRIYEPFFTTKEVGKGTGLGLATVFGIIQQHQGWINVFSEVDHGTTFRIYLPRQLRISPSAPGPAASAALPGGDETILVVEDDMFVRASLRATLAKLGYHVLEAADGAEALEVWREHAGKIRLLLTDLVMPGELNGRDLAEHLLRDNPKLKVIYASGYSAEIASADFPLEDGINFLSKPFHAQQLAETIRVRLDH